MVSEMDHGWSVFFLISFLFNFHQHRIMNYYTFWQKQSPVSSMHQTKLEDRKTQVLVASLCHCVPALKYLWGRVVNFVLVGALPPLSTPLLMWPSSALWPRKARETIDLSVCPQAKGPWSALEDTHYSQGQSEGTHTQIWTHAGAGFSTQFGQIQASNPRCIKPTCIQTQIHTVCGCTDVMYI